MSETEMNRLKLGWLLVLSMFVAGCSSGHDDYLGLWERTNVNHHAVLEIKRDGGTYLMIENILRDTDILGNKQTGVVLTKQQGMLVVNTGFGSLALGLSGDERVLHLSDQSYRKIDANRVDAIRQEIKDEALAAERSEQRCKALREKYYRAYRDASEAEDVHDLPSKLALVKRLDAQFDEEKRVGKIDACPSGLIFY